MRNLVAIVLLLSTGCVTSPAAAPRTTTEGLSDAVAVVQRQLDAYNARNADAFAATYAPDVKIYNFPDKLLMSGREELRQRYGAVFAASPKLHARILNRVVRGNFVIDDEHVTGRGEAGEIRAVAIYEVRDGLIQNVWFIR